MATPSLTQQYSIKEFQLLVKDAPVGPAEIQPFVGIQFRGSDDIYRAFKELPPCRWKPSWRSTWTARTAWWG